MKVINEVEYYKIGEVCKMIDRSHSTIKIWYEAAEYAQEHDIHFPFILPIFRRDIDNKGTRYLPIEGVKALIKFRDNLAPGDLAFYTREKMRRNPDTAIIVERQEFKEAIAEDFGQDLDKLTEEVSK